MDGSSAPPPDVLSGQSDAAADVTESVGRSASKSTTLPGSGSPSSTLSAKQQLSSLKPGSLLHSISTQLLGEKSPQQQQIEQEQAAKVQQQIAASQQEFQQYQAQRQAQEQQRVSQTIEMKAQAVKLGSYSESSAVLSQTTQGDLSEQRVIEIAMKNAQEAKAREQKARQAMMSHSTPKGPQAEGGQAKTSMISQMQSGSESGDHKLSDDQDARQRQREQAMGE